MTRILLLVLLQLCCTTLSAQDDKQTFHAYLYNNEYDVYLRINFYDQDIEVPGQSLYGKLPGFLGKVEGDGKAQQTAADSAHTGADERNSTLSYGT